MAALVTPFTDDGRNVDEERLRHLINHLIDLGVTGLVPCGTTGEFQNLSEEERRRVVEAAVDEANGRVPVIAGTGASGTDLAIEKARHAVRRAIEGWPSADELIENKERAKHPFKYTP